MGDDGVALIALPISLTDTIRKRLLLVKQFYRNAFRLSSQHDGSSKLLAVVQFQLANETAMAATIAAFSSPGNAYQNLNAMFQEADKHLPAPSLPQRTNVNRVLSIRNAAIHEARMPTDFEVNDCRTYTRDFLNELLTLVWGITLDGLYLADTISDEATRDLMRQAEVALANEDHVAAVRHASAALDLRIERTKRAWLGRNRGFHRRSGIKELDDVDERVEALEQAFFHLAFAIDQQQLERLRSVAGYVWFADRASPPYFEPIYTTKQINPSPSEAEFVVVFASEVIHSLEERVKTFPRPSWEDGSESVELSSPD